MARSALNFLGFGSRKATTAGDPPADDEEKDPKAAEDKDPKAAAGPDEDDDEEDDDDEEAKKAQAAAVASAVTAERQRIAGIVNSGGAGKVEAALQIALNTDMTVDEASKLLAALPESGKRSPLAAAMAGRSPQVGPGTASTPKPKSLADVMKAQLAERGLAGKEA